MVKRRRSRALLAAMAGADLRRDCYQCVALTTMFAEMFELLQSRNELFWVSGGSTRRTRNRLQRPGSAPHHLRCCGFEGEQEQAIRAQCECECGA